MFFLLATRQSLAMVTRLAKRMEHEGTWDQSAWNQEQFLPAYGSHKAVGVSTRVMNYLCNLNSKTFFRFIREDSALLHNPSPSPSPNPIPSPSPNPIPNQVTKDADGVNTTDPAFRLYMQTKLPNPHYIPEIQAQTTLVNFTVTEKGLEDQLLATVVGCERPDLLEEQSDLTKQQNDFTIKLQASY